MRQRDRKELDCMKKENKRKKKRKEEEEGIRLYEARVLWLACPYQEDA